MSYVTLRESYVTGFPCRRKIAHLARSCFPCRGKIAQLVRSYFPCRRNVAQLARLCFPCRRKIAQLVRSCFPCRRNVAQLTRSCFPCHQKVAQLVFANVELYIFPRSAIYILGEVDQLLSFLWRRIIILAKFDRHTLERQFKILLLAIY